MKKKISLIKARCVLFGLLIFASCTKDDNIPDIEPSTILGNINTLLIEQDITDISVGQAVNVAKLFILEPKSSKIAFSKSTIPNKEIENTTTIFDSDNNPSMHIINFKNNSGFVIISATKRYEPILAYSDKGSFDMNHHIPEGIADWIDQTKASIQYHKENDSEEIHKFRYLWSDFEQIPEPLAARSYPMDPGLAMLEEEFAKWRANGFDYVPIQYAYYMIPPEDYAYFCQEAERFAHPDLPYMQNAYIMMKKESPIEKIGPLLSALWTQRAGFNEKCFPKGIEAPAGCVAIAMAQIMRYHEWPAYYRWNEMHDIIAKSETQSLIRDIGIDVDMNYASDGSSSTPDKALDAFNSSHWGYNAKKIDHNTEVIKNEIRQKRPVYMSGKRSKFIIIPYNGHSWICDGYHRSSSICQYTALILTKWGDKYSVMQIGNMKSSGYVYEKFHMNWGWGGNYNGWYGDGYFPEDYNYEHGRCNIIVKPNK